jgi:paraquat-inducible protein B
MDSSSGDILKGDRTTLQEEVVQALIKRGLRAQLEMQSVVTGQLLIALEFHPAARANFVDRDKRYLEIPTIPTQLQQLRKRLESVPIEEIILELQSTLAAIQKVANAPEIPIIMASGSKGIEETRLLIHRIDGELGPLANSTNEAVQEIRKLAATMDSELGPLTARIENVSEEAGATLRRAQTAIENINRAVGDDSALAYQLPKTLKELEGATRSIRLLADELSQHPEALVWGKRKTGGE